MTVMLEVLSDLGLHIRAAEGFKTVGQSIDLHGGEDAEVCREAGVLWNEPTTEGYPNMRAKINAEVACIEEEFNSGGLTWCESDVKLLISPYPAHERIDKVLDKFGRGFLS